MIYGIGIDLVKIERLKTAIEKWGDKFLKRVFTDEEISYCYKKNNPYFSFAVRFAAKEALIKAIGSEVAVPLTDIEVSNSEKGKPVIKANGKLKIFLTQIEIRRILLSLSHEREYGIACVVLEK